MDGLQPPYPPCAIIIVLTRGSNFILHTASEVAFSTRGKKRPVDKDKRHILHCTIDMSVNCIPCTDCTLVMSCNTLTDCTLPRHSVQPLAPGNQLFFTSFHLRSLSVAISICFVIYHLIFPFSFSFPFSSFFSLTPFIVQLSGTNVSLESDLVANL
jgi:hypothetical protein